MTGPAHLLTDLRLQLRDARLRPIYRYATEFHRVPNRPGRFEDMATVDGYDNLGQSILVRLLTMRGELGPLGHPAFGSRLHELIGSRNTAGVLGLAKLHVLEALANEPRITDEIDVDVQRAAGARDALVIRVVVRPVGEQVTVVVGPFTLEFGS